MLGKRRPALLVEGFVEPRQHHRAVRQRGDDFKQPRRRRHGAGRSRGDHGMRRAIARAVRPPSPSTRCGARPARRAACPRDICGQCSVTILRNSTVSCQCPANSSGTMASSRERSISSRFDHVDQVGEIGGKIRGLSGRHVDDCGGRDAALGRGLEAKQVPEGEHEPHQSQPSRQRADRRLRRARRRPRDSLRPRR